MRGRSLLKEPSSPSICALCAHRLGAARRPSHGQRRFLQSSRPVSKPPAAGEALREKIEDVPQSRQANPSWGRPGGAKPAVSWGRQLPGQPSWGQKPVDADSKNISTEHKNPSFPAPATENLLPHELRAQKLLRESQARKIWFPTGAGPESTRAGRPLPPRPGARSHQERLAIARDSFARKKAIEAELRQRSAQRLAPGPFRIDRPSNHVMGDVEPRHENLTDMRVYRGVQWKGISHWQHLQREKNTPAVIASALPPEKSEPLMDEFSRARAQREEQARARRYTPLSSRSIYSGPQRDLVPPDLQQDASNQPVRSWSMGRQAIRRDTDRQEAMKKNESNLSFREDQGEGTSSVPQDQSVIVSTNPDPHITISRPVSFTPKSASTDVGRADLEGGTKDFPEHNARDHEEQPKKMPARFASAKTEFDAMPKGKGKDKARRRQQFMEDDADIEDELEERRRRTELKKQRKLEKEAKKAAAPIPILLPEFISVSNLAMALRVRVEDFIERLEDLGYHEMTTDYILNSEDSGLVAMEYNYEAIIDRGESEDLKAREPAADLSVLPQRPPVVTIMGHVDHGKTTLLDWLRKSSVAATEHGGITQHIGAFSVPMPSGKVITFLDTPGHAAFLSMRQRGANVTDIVILVVAADDSVKPQTIEAIKHAQTAKVPIIVAINKVDKEDANVDRVKQDLARHGVDVEDFGGDTQVVCVSGKTGQGMGELEEAAVTLSEILDMRAEIDGQAEGWVLEASIKSMGKVATVLVRRGTVRIGDFIVAGKTWARIRCLRNEAGVEIESAGPGTPVEIDGWRDQPEAGDEVLQAPDEAKAKSVVDYRLEKAERDKMALDMEAINENRKIEQDKRGKEKKELASQIEAEAADVDHTLEVSEKKFTGPKELYFIVKGDVSGSVEAVNDSISVLGNKEVQARILRSGVGQISEFDIEHAAAAKGYLINFNTPLDPHISQLAEKNKVTVIDHNIIYRLVDDVRAELSKHLPPLITHRVLGEAEIAQIFSITVKGRQQKNIAGCKVRNGTIARNAKVRVLRNNVNVFDGSLASLKNVKKDVQEMKKGTECGMGFDNWFDFHVGDLIQSYEEIREKRYL